MASTTTTVTFPIPPSTTAATAPAPPPSKAERLPIEVTKATPYVYSLSYLTATDPNPLPPSTTLTTLPRSSLNAQLLTIARDGTQSLITTLLTTTTITSTPDALLMQLPPIPSTTITTNTNPLLRLPRHKPLPKPKAPTKWETFARKKGIGKHSGSASGGAKLEERKKNMIYDEEKGEWVKKWGYKGKNMMGGSEWLVEVDDQKQKKESEGVNLRGEAKRERMERVRRQQRKERHNTKKAGGGGKGGG